MQTKENITVIDEAVMPPEMDQRIRELLCICFPSDVEVFSETRHWHGSAPEYSVVACRAGKALGHVGVVGRTILSGNTTVDVAGVQNVAVHPDHRGTGLGSALMIHAMDEARDRGKPSGLLFCVPELGPYYERPGWQALDVDARMDYEGQVNIPIPGKNICMVDGLAGDSFPAGALHLQGPDW